MDHRNLEVGAYFIATPPSRSAANVLRPTRCTGFAYDPSVSRRLVCLDFSHNRPAYQLDRGTMNGDGDLVNVMLVIAFVAVTLVVGELYIVNKPAGLPAILVPQQQLDRAP
jgi:hypothetical protein